MVAARLARTARQRQTVPASPRSERPEVLAPAAHRCRLCVANDVDGLIERLAEELWDSRRYGTLDDRPWVQAGEYWQRTFRELTETVVTSRRA